MIRLATISQIDCNEVRLSLQSNKECNDCKSRCSDGFLSFLFHKASTEDLVVSLTNKSKQTAHLVDQEHFFQGGYSVSDIVGLKFDEKELFRLSLYLYGVPIALLLIMLGSGYGFFSWLHINADLGGLLGFVCGVYLAKLLIKYQGLKLRPRVTFFK